MLNGICQGIVWFLEIIRFAVMMNILLNWFIPPNHGVMRFLERITDPLLRPIRNLLFRIAPRMIIDPSPLVFFLLVGLLIRFVRVIFIWL